MSEGKSMMLDRVEQIMKIVSMLVLSTMTFLAVFFPSVFNKTLDGLNHNINKRNLELKYVEFAFDIIKDGHIDYNRDKWIEWASRSILGTEDIFNLPQIHVSDTAKGDIYIVENVSEINEDLLTYLKEGEFKEISVNSFVPVIVASKQVDGEEIGTFINNAHDYFKKADNRELYNTTYDPKEFNRWDIEVQGGGKVMIFRTRNGQEFMAAWDGVLKVLEALKGENDLSGIKFLVRGTDRFFDIKGIGGVGGRTWIAFDLRR